MNSKRFKKTIGLVKAYAKAERRVLAVGLCGSHARGTARPDSDIDFSIIVKDKEWFRSTDWLVRIDFREIDDELDHFSDKIYGNVWSRHVFLKSSLELEFSFADKAWTDCLNPDPGTIKVVSDGYRILYDPDLLLDALVEKIFPTDNSE